MSQPGSAGSSFAGERTSLAWARIGLALLAIPGAMFAYASSKEIVAIVASGLAGLLGLMVLTSSLTRRRVDSGSAPLASTLVLSSGCAVVLLCLGAAVLVQR